MSTHVHPVALPGGGAGTRSSVSEILSRHGPAFLAANVVTPPQARVLRDLKDCRSAAMGGHVDACDECTFKHYSYNSCRNRHCPGCQNRAQEEWIASRLARLLETVHFHTVFTVPSELRGLFLANPRTLYDLFFRVASETLQELAKDRLGVVLGITAILHTWTRDMSFHPHLHCIVTGGGLSLDGTQWKAAGDGDYLLPLKPMCALFRGKFMAGLVALERAGGLNFAGTSADLADPVAFARLRRKLYATAWHIYAKPAFGGAEQVIRYLGRYTHRVAISASRILSVTDTQIAIRTRGGHKVRVTPAEFVRRFVLHVLPDGLRKIRHYGLFAPSNVNTKLVDAQSLLPKRQRRPEPVIEHVVFDETERRCPACDTGTLHRQLLARNRARPPP